MPQAVLLALPSLPCLVGLELRCQRLAPPGTAEQLSTAVHRLPRLCSLHFSASRIHVPQQLIDSIVRLTRLTRLGLECSLIGDATDLQQLTGLMLLQHLQLTIAASRWQAPEPAAFPSLQSYQFSGGYYEFFVGSQPQVS
jgi:hypothetical protein